MTGRVSRAAARAAAKDHGISLDDVDMIMSRATDDVSKWTVSEVRDAVREEFSFLDQEYREVHGR